jgi:hypothetical protein
VQKKWADPKNLHRCRMTPRQKDGQSVVL